jgi:hypothetical protein
VQSTDLSSHTGGFRAQRGWFISPPSWQLSRLHIDHLRRINRDFCGGRPSPESHLVGGRKASGVDFQVIMTSGWEMQDANRFGWSTDSRTCDPRPLAGMRRKVGAGFATETVGGRRHDKPKVPACACDATRHHGRHCRGVVFALARLGMVMQVRRISDQTRQLTKRLNPYLRKIAGTRLGMLFFNLSALHHVGRRSERNYVTPLRRYAAVWAAARSATGVIMDPLCRVRGREALDAPLPAGCRDAHHSPTAWASSGLRRLTISGSAFVNGKSGRSSMWVSNVAASTLRE